MVEEREIICGRENALGGPLIYVDRSLTDYVSYMLLDVYWKPTFISRLLSTTAPVAHQCEHKSHHQLTLIAP